MAKETARRRCGQVKDDSDESGQWKKREKVGHMGVSEISEAWRRRREWTQERSLRGEKNKSRLSRHSKRRARIARSASGWVGCSPNAFAADVLSAAVKAPIMQCVK